MTRRKKEGVFNNTFCAFHSFSFVHKHIHPILCIFYLFFLLIFLCSCSKVNLAASRGYIGLSIAAVVCVISLVLALLHMLLTRMAHAPARLAAPFCFTDMPSGRRKRVGARFCCPTTTTTKKKTKKKKTECATKTGEENPKPKSKARARLNV